ncbi:MAG: hypothetical protein MET45_22450 [Nostoc sp. LLA-1]|nr:hypothetical protein [Cyanocohniella sp. LLY]
METKKLLIFASRAISLAILSSPLVVLSPADALPPGVPRDRCGTLSNPQVRSLCYTVTPGGGKVNAGGDRKDFPSIIIQSTEPEYVIADVIIEFTSSAGDISRPSVSQLSPGGQAAIVSVAREKLRELQQIRGELQAKATVLSGPALIEAQAKLSALQEQERIYENVVTTTTAAGQDAGKFQVGGASARSRKCGWANLDTCGSWVEYNVYAVKRYVGNPIAAYNRAFAVAQDARNTITRLVEQSQQTPAACSPSYDPRAYRPGSSGWTGRIGRIAFNNGTSNPIKVTLYHPDAPDLAFQSWTVQPGQNLFLGENNYAVDWGIQANGSPICIVGRVSAWNQFNGQFIFQSGFPFTVHN